MGLSYFFVAYIGKTNYGFEKILIKTHPAVKLLLLKSTICNDLQNMLPFDSANSLAKRWSTKKTSKIQESSTILGPPLKIVKLGETQVPYTVFIDYVGGLSESTYAGSTYSLFTHNCNNFSEEISQFLCGISIPKYILDLPNDILNTPLAPALQLIVRQLETSARPIAEDRFSRAKDSSPDLEQLNAQIEEARYNSILLEERRKRSSSKFLRKAKKAEKKREKLHKEGHPVPVQLEEAKMSDCEITEINDSDDKVPSDFIDLEEEERREEEEKKKLREPPIVFRDSLDPKIEFDALLNLIDGKLNEDEQKSMEELQIYLFGDEGSWTLSDGFLSFIGRLLYDNNLPPEVRIRTMNLLAIAALKDDVILVLHQDRKEHVLMNYAFDIDQITIEEQEAVALFVTNLFENLSSSEWLMYISEWMYHGQQTSNIRVTTKVAVHSLLSDSPVLQDRGAAIVHNIACKEVFDDVAVELTMALLQYFNYKASEEQMYRCLKALSRFMRVSTQEVPQLIKMIGPDPKTFRGLSERVDALIEEISARLN